MFVFFFSSRRRHTRSLCDWSSDVCSSDLFEAERQALALMDHPNIGRVLDGGETASGRPYFVMELVKGVPITRYCDEHRSEERRVGKECGSRWSRDHERKKRRAATARVALC